MYEFEFDIENEAGGFSHGELTVEVTNFSYHPPTTSNPWKADCPADLEGDYDIEWEITSATWYHYDGENNESGAEYLTKAMGDKHLTPDHIKEIENTLIEGEFERIEDDKIAAAEAKAEALMEDKYGY